MQAAPCVFNNKRQTGFMLQVLSTDVNNNPATHIDLLQNNYAEHCF